MSLNKLSSPAIGDKVPVKFGKETDQQVVCAPCEDAKNGRWYCVTHRQHFDNQLQKDSHITVGTHKLVWLCFAHGPEVDPKWFKPEEKHD